MWGKTCSACEIAAVGRNNGQRGKIVSRFWGLQILQKEDNGAPDAEIDLFRNALASVAVER
jgi:peroxiredoxin family protein